jgi:hypothetical protein
MRILPAVCGALLLAAGLVPSEASADVPLSFRLGYASQVSTARAYDLVDQNDHLPLFRVGAAWAFTVPRGRLEVEAGFLSGGSSAQLHLVSEADLGLTGVELGAAYRLRLGSVVEPYAQALVGYDWLSLRVGALRQGVGQVSATGLLGVSFLVSTRTGEDSSPTILFDLGVGYGLRPEARFDALAPEPPDEDVEEPIASTPVSLGAMPLSGVTYRLQVGLRF